MFLYEFDLFGIIYTVLTAVLSVLLIVAAVLFATRKKPSGKGTVAFRVLDIILLAALVALWALFVLAKTGAIGLSASDDGSLGVSFGTGASLNIPHMGALVAVWDAVLGILLLSAVTLMSVLSLVFSFVFRSRRIGRDESEEMTSADEYYSDETPVRADPVPEKTEDVSVPVSDPVPSAEEAHAAETPVAADEPEGEEPQASEPVHVKADEEITPDDDIMPAPEETDTAEEVSAEPVTETAEPVAPVTKKEQTAGAIAENRPDYDYLTEKRGPSAKVYASALQRPGMKKKSGSGVIKQVERVRPVIPPPLKITRTEPQVRRAENAERSEERPLPVTRRLVITNRLNVVNIFNDYLKEKDEEERKKLSESIEQIELGEK